MKLLAILIVLAIAVGVGTLAFLAIRAAILRATADEWRIEVDASGDRTRVFLRRGAKTLSVAAVDPMNGDALAAAMDRAEEMRAEIEAHR
jgi:hypothetical protein